MFFFFLRWPRLHLYALLFAALIYGKNDTIDYSIKIAPLYSNFYVLGGGAKTNDEGELEGELKLNPQHCVYSPNRHFPLHVITVPVYL
jgi:hypothetical protein